ncbi:PREDICTED: LOW QUALITY PROTEIN: EMBRYO SURROUNDING FACTOR 1.2-like [Camelina sativa]|uniref:LOW QUALITY PROTEIN: EMBRYO SURROUNDING FACTOR 1.2-like n=1 Tax=Camelina sativa TaxID=90675 RepID=A0ABM1QY24_CAMSA|nr:PREDICTED: LOW QUALITY PROTEIN: EMBRYO SURROUNDING FACTOR 1.2-like [Camelina sativa]
MKSPTVIFFIFMFSFFALQQCMHVDVRKIDSVSKLQISNCVPAKCGEGFFKRNCWCCFHDQTICYNTQKICESSLRCPPLKFNLLEN